MEATHISSHVDVCAKAFLNLSSALTTTPRFATQISANAVNDEFDRFKIWTGNIAAHRKGRRSLEYRLRDAAHLRDETQNLLIALQASIAEASAIVRGEKVPWDELSNSDSDSDSDFEQPVDASKQGQQNDTELKQLSASIKNTVTCLFRLSMVIREPAPDSQLRSTITIDKSYYERHDVQHVQEKFGRDDFLAERLGRAISGRRQYLAYREDHHQKLSKNVERLGFEDAKTEHTTNSTEATPVPSQEPKDALVLDDGEDTHSQTSYATSVNTTIRVPRLPKEAREQEHFECPFCFMIVSLHTNTAWKQHVYRDLHPYSCTFEHCATADRLYDSRRAWWKHELEAHRTSWQCIEGCEQIFTSERQFIAHVKTTHTDLAGDAMLSALKRTAARSANPADRALCPLCGQEMSLRMLQKHLGRHQEQLALFVLPPNLDATEEELDEQRSSIGPTQEDQEDASDASESLESDHAGSENSNEESSSKQELLGEDEENNKTKNAMINALFDLPEAALAYYASEKAQIDLDAKLERQALVDAYNKEQQENEVRLAARRDQLLLEYERKKSNNPVEAAKHREELIIQLKIDEEKQKEKEEGEWSRFLTNQKKKEEEEQKLLEDRMRERLAQNGLRDHVIETIIQSKRIVSQSKQIQREIDLETSQKSPVEEQRPTLRPNVVKTADDDGGIYSNQSGPQLGVQIQPGVLSSGTERSEPHTDRRLGPSSYWSVNEQIDFHSYIAHFGTDFVAIANHMGTKTHTMVKNMYLRLIEDDRYPELAKVANEADQRRALARSRPLVDNQPNVEVTADDENADDLDAESELQARKAWQDLRAKREQKEEERLETMRQKAEEEESHREQDPEESVGPNPLTIVEHSRENSDPDDADRVRTLSNLDYVHSNVEEDQYSYTDAAGMYHDTEPVWRDKRRNIQDAAPSLSEPRRTHNDEREIRGANTVLESNAIEPQSTATTTPKGILRRPREIFPEESNPIREGVAPHKASLKGKDAPVGSRWTRIDRQLVNPQALVEAKERFEERMDCVIVLRVLTKDDIQKLADRTKEIREARSREYEASGGQHNDDSDIVYRWRDLRHVGERPLERQRKLDNPNELQHPGIGQKNKDQGADLGRGRTHMQHQKARLLTSFDAGLAQDESYITRPVFRGHSSPPASPQYQPIGVKHKESIEDLSLEGNSHVQPQLAAGSGSYSSPDARVQTEHGDYVVVDAGDRLPSESMRQGLRMRGAQDNSPDQ